MSDVDDRVEFFRSMSTSRRRRVDAFLEQCSCMNEEDKAVLSKLLDELEDPEGVCFMACPEGGAQQPTKKLSALICEKCRTVLRSWPVMKVPVR